MVSAGTAYAAIEPDFTPLKAKLAAELRDKQLTQKIRIDADTSTLRRAQEGMRSFGGYTERTRQSVEGRSAGFRELYAEAGKITAIGIGSQAVSALGAATASGGLSSRRWSALGRPSRR